MDVLFVFSALTAMHRKSIGSPASKHHHQQVLLQIDGDVDRKRRPSSAVSGGGADEAIWAEKIARSTSDRDVKVLHLIPLLVLLCFFILYLHLHDPVFHKIIAVGDPFDRIAASTE
ncbi:hypothetical protein QJS10_CPB14g01214 [Acorus calamus]|uniref:Uncharacterized protein n=1 Tax=Acorus calamus TaxID=4465 RepID=A0AAV9DAF5_ACOCL|nr:hypothetical protein QJS10_CPB14g01214 [Acorus calamus]